MAGRPPLGAPPFEEAAEGVEGLPPSPAVAFWEDGAPPVSLTAPAAPAKLLDPLRLAGSSMSEPSGEDEHAKDENSATTQME